MSVEYYIDSIDRAQKEQSAIYHNVASKYNISDTVMWTLYIIDSVKEHCTQQEVCRQSFFPKQTVNSAITKLVKEGYAELEMIPGTKNQKKIILTKKGMELADRTSNRVREAEIRAYKRIKEDELKKYLEISSTITTYLREEFEKI